MQTTTNNYKSSVKASKRIVEAKAELYNGAALVATYTKNDAIKNITIDRTAEDSKFFGFGVIHKVNVKLIDVTRTINISTANHLKLSIGLTLDNGTVEYIPFPYVYVTEVNRDENTNELSITAYDVLNKFKSNLVNELNLSTPYTIKDFLNACGALMGLTVVIPDSLEVFNTSYTDGANFEGSETIQEALNAAAEATQTIYFINSDNKLVFKRLDKSGAAVKTISKEEYITLDSGTNRRLQTIANVTELGDNVEASITETGTTQYIRNNAFLELREDINTMLQTAIAAVGGLTINQFNCEWRGDPSIEFGDKLSFITKDNKTVTSYLLNDTITYNGGLSEKTEWNYTESEETESNPATLGETLKQTRATVDKVNKEVNIIVSEVENNKSNISNLYLDTESISASVQSIESSTKESIDNLNNDLNTLTNKVEASMTAEDVTIAIKSELSNGVNKVETTTGFTLDENGLTISKTGSEMTTNIDEDGMTIQADNEDRLIADNEGVVAYNLHAKTYLIVGESSRFEDYEKDGETRTGCFWIGG